MRTGRDGVHPAHAHAVRRAGEEPAELGADHAVGARRGAVRSDGDWCRPDEVIVGLLSPLKLEPQQLHSTPVHINQLHGRIYDDATPRNVVH